MPGKANCLVCGKPLVYHAAARPATCVFCGTTELAHSVCADGHYVCDACHRERGVACIMDVCRTGTERDPIALMNQAMRLPSLYQNGPEHHTLVGAALLAAYAHAGGTFPAFANLDEALGELKTRSMTLPGGMCGFWGCCGAAVSAGQALSIITGATPFSTDAWGACQRLTGTILQQLADQGGPRCCKRTGYTAALASVDAIAQATGVRLDAPSRVTCAFFPRNEECLHGRCPYYPAEAPTVSEPARA